MPYRCRGKDCRKFFSVKVGTVMQDSKLGYQEWAIAIYLYNTNLKSASSMKLRRDLGISQRRRGIRRTATTSAGTTWRPRRSPGRSRPTRATWAGGAKNMHARVRRERIHGRGGMDKTVAAGLRDRASCKVTARVVAASDGPTLRGLRHPPSSSDATNNNHAPPDSHKPSPTNGTQITRTHKRVPLSAGHRRQAAHLPRVDRGATRAGAVGAAGRLTNDELVDA